MTMDDVSEARDAIEHLVRQAGSLALGYFRQLAVDSVHLKGHLDLVTAAAYVRITIGSNEKT